MSEIDLEWVINYGFAAVVVVYLLARFEGIVKDMTRQIRLNTIVLARVTGQDLTKVEREFTFNGEEKK